MTTSELLQDLQDELIEERHECEKVIDELYAIIDMLEKRIEQLEFELKMNDAYIWHLKCFIEDLGFLPPEPEDL